MCIPARLVAPRSLTTGSEPLDTFALLVDSKNSAEAWCGTAVDGLERLASQSIDH